MFIIIVFCSYIAVTTSISVQKTLDPYPFPVPEKSFVSHGENTSSASLGDVLQDDRLFDENGDPLPESLVITGGRPISDFFPENMMQMETNTSYRNCPGLGNCHTCGYAVAGISFNRQHICCPTDSVYQVASFIGVDWCGLMPNTDSHGDYYQCFTNEMCQNRCYFSFCADSWSRGTRCLMGSTCYMCRTGRARWNWRRFGHFCT